MSKTKFSDIAIIALLVVIALLLAGATQPIATRDVYQYIDHDSGVVCYILENGHGISCLPLDEVENASP